MTNRRRFPWLHKRLALMSLLVCFAAACTLGKAMRPKYPAPDLAESDATGTCLDRRIARYHVVNMQLERVVEDLGRLTQQTIKVEWETLDPANPLTHQVRVTIDLDDVSLYSALQTAFGTAKFTVRYGVSRGVVTLSKHIWGKQVFEQRSAKFCGR